VVSPLINPNIRAITAITNSTCINPVAEYAKVPIAHPMIRITAMIYNSDLMILCFKQVLK
jgi:hypothetical protein